MASHTTARRDALSRASTRRMGSGVELAGGAQPRSVQRLRQTVLKTRASAARRKPLRERFDAGATEAQHDGLWARPSEQRVNLLPVRCDAPELLPHGVVGAPEGEYVGCVIDDRLALAGHDALQLLAGSEDRCVLGQDSHATRG